MARKEALELLLDCKLIVLTWCDSKSKLHGELVEEIKLLKKKLIELEIIELEMMSPDHP